MFSLELVLPLNRCSDWLTPPSGRTSFSSLEWGSDEKHLLAPPSFEARTRRNATLVGHESWCPTNLFLRREILWVECLETSSVLLCALEEFVRREVSHALLHIEGLYCLSWLEIQLYLYSYTDFWCHDFHWQSMDILNFANFVYSSAAYISTSDLFKRFLEEQLDWQTLFKSKIILFIQQETRRKLWI